MEEQLQVETVSIMSCDIYLYLYISIINDKYPKYDTLVCFRQTPLLHCDCTNAEDFRWTWNYHVK